jgi:hypothetical protein
MPKTISLEDSELIMSDVKKLISAESLKKQINVLNPGNQIHAFWANQISNGYLTAECTFNKNEYMLRIPNLEVNAIYQRWMIEYKNYKSSSFFKPATKKRLFTLKVKDAFDYHLKDINFLNFIKEFPISIKTEEKLSKNISSKKMLFILNNSHRLPITEKKNDTLSSINSEALNMISSEKHHQFTAEEKDQNTNQKFLSKLFKKKASTSPENSVKNNSFQVTKNHRIVKNL